MLTSQGRTLASQGEILVSHTDQLEIIASAATKHEDQLTRITEKLLEHDERFVRIEEKLDKKADEHTMNLRFDSLERDVKNISDEYIVSRDWMRRVDEINEKTENKVVGLEQDITKMKPLLGLA